MSKPRKKFTAEQKADVVRRHVRDKVSVSELASELDLQPIQIQLWVATVLAQADKAFQSKPGRSAKDPQVKLAEDSQRQVKRLEEKLQAKNEVISELMEENIKSKKANGDP
jgi:transposase-like protein